MTIKDILISASSLNPLAAHWWNTSRGTETSRTLKLYSTENMRWADLSTSSGSDIRKSTTDRCAGHIKGIKGLDLGGKCWNGTHINKHYWPCLFVWFYIIPLYYTLWHNTFPFYFLQSHKKVNIFLAAAYPGSPLHPTDQQAPEIGIMNPQMNLSRSIGCQVFPQSTKHTPTGNSHSLGQWGWWL